jgi:hypothetical protein
MLWFFITVACIATWTFFGLRAHGATSLHNLRDLIDTKEEASIGLGILGIIIFLYGHTYLYQGFNYTALVNDFYANITVDLFSIFLTVLILDKLNERRAEQQEESEKQSIIGQIGSSNNTFALEAVKLADRKGWLADGSLNGKNLSNANLEEAYLANAKLSNVNLENSILYKANLSGANLTNANFNNTDLTRANFRVADLRGTSFKDAIWDGTDFRGALYDASTAWPDGFDSGQAGAVTGDVPIDEEIALTKLQRELRHILSILYSDVSSARRIVDDASLESSFIDFHGSAQDMWRNILEEARLTQKVDQLISMAKENYPHYAPLQAVWDEYKKLFSRNWINE